MEHTMHSLKTDPEVFEAVLSGKKTYEIRKNDDRTFKVGDFLRLMETQYTGEEMKSHHNGAYPGAMVEGKPLVFTGRTCLVEITHILEGPIYGLKEGWALLSITLGDDDPTKFCETWQDTRNWGNPWHSACGAYWTGGPLEYGEASGLWPFCPGCGKRTRKVKTPAPQYRPEDGQDWR